MTIPAKIKVNCKKCNKQFIQQSKTNLFCKKCHRSIDKYKDESYERESGLFLNKYREM